MAEWLLETGTLRNEVFEMNEREIKILQEEGILEAYKTVGEYRILLDVGFGDASQTVWFRVNENSDGRYSCDQSHGIQTPIQGDPYWSDAISDTAEEALAGAVKAMLMYYNGAKKQGHEPSEDWFVPDQDYFS